MRCCNVLFVMLQEEDASLVPTSADAGFQFEPAGGAPHDAFRF